MNEDNSKINNDDLINKDENKKEDDIIKEENKN